MRSILEVMEEESTWEVTELNTRKKTFKNAVRDIFEGDDYKTHSFRTREEAETKVEELKAEGIRTNLARVVRIN